MLTTKTYYQLFSEQAKLHPDRIAIIMGQVRISYADFVWRINEVASFLIRKGLKKDDHVILWGNNSPDWLIAFYGIIRAGGVAVTLNANYTINAVAPLVSFADGRIVLFGPTHDTFGIAEETERLSKSFGLPGEKIFPYLNMDFSHSDPVVIDDALWDVKDDACLIYTSGTTNFPKAVLLSQYSMINTVLGCGEELQRVLGNKTCVAVPLFHAFGQGVPCLYLSKGYTVCLPERIEANAIAEIVEREAITDIWAVSTVYQSIADDDKTLQRCAPTLKMCAVAGSYTSAAQLSRFEVAFHNAMFLNMFGMTEASFVFIAVRPDDPINIRYNTIGRKIPGIEIGICCAASDTAEKTHLLGTDEIGELVTKGFHIKNGYYRLPPEEQSIDENGWFHTGDLGTIDKDGNIRIVGRIKDIIIKGGENIMPGEIESELLKEEGIEACRVFGFEDRLYGENLGACITLKDGMTFNEKEVREHLKEKLGSFKVPAFFFVFDLFPLNATGKIDQRSLHMQMLSRIRARKPKINRTNPL